MSEIIQTLSKVKNYNSQKMSEIELLPCPFCGGKAEVRATKRLVFIVKYMGTVHYVVGCIDTKCIGRIQRRYNSIEEAIDAWSTRKTIHRIVEQLEKELQLADKEKARCARENPLQFDSAKGYASGIATAIEIVKGGGINE